jgi:DNA-binding PadR family transcriptional regulator
MERLSELEGVVLGMLWSMGPKTAYSIRQIFLKSPSPHWATSAGTIYPLMKRLHERGHIRSERHATGRREGLLYTVTPAGLKALRRWIGPHPPPIATAIPVDPLRLRLRFMGVLNDRDQETLIKSARRDLIEWLKKFEAEAAQHRKDGDPFLSLAYHGVIATMKSRLALLKEAEKAMAAAKKKA